MSKTFTYLWQCCDGRQHGRGRSYFAYRLLEVSFFVTDEALRRLEPGARVDENSLLPVFEAHHDRVLRAAARVYARGRKGSYEIGADDVRRSALRPGFYCFVCRRSSY